MIESVAVKNCCFTQLLQPSRGLSTHCIFKGCAFIYYTQGVVVRLFKKETDVCEETGHETMFYAAQAKALLKISFSHALLPC